MSDVWLKFAQFLGTLNGENVKRESYVRTPEFEAALEAWKGTEQEWEAFLESLPADGQEKAEEMKECLEDFSSAQEKRAYIQGYADCIQVLFHMGLLKENEELKWQRRWNGSSRCPILRFWQNMGLGIVVLQSLFYFIIIKF